MIQQLDGNVIGPKIVGNALGISSFWVLIAVLMGGGLFGFTGMVFGVPVFAVIYRYLDKLTIRTLRYKEKPTSTADYFSLEKYGVDDRDVELEAPSVTNKSMFNFGRRDGKKKEAATEIDKSNSEVSD